MGRDATALQKSPETLKAAATVRPTESEIAALAYQLWLDKGCPVGSEQEDWLQAEAMIENALAARCEDLWRLAWAPRCDTSDEDEMLDDLGWKGHWEVWEMEWGPHARWIWD
jgi:hypothetical protein